MFWGLILEPQKKYTQTVTKSFKVTMAAMDETTTSEDSASSQVIVTSEDRNYLICSVKKDTNPQQKLSLCFMEGETISFATNGTANIHLTGYLIPEDDFEDIEDGDATLDEMVELPKKRARNTKPAAVIEPPIKKSKTMELLEKYGEEDDSDDSDVHPSDLSLEDTTVLEDDDDSDEGNEDDGDVDDEEEDNDSEEADDSDVEEEGDDDDDDEEEDVEEEEEPVKEKKLNGTPRKENKKAEKNQLNIKETKMSSKQKTSPTKASNAKNGTSPAKKVVEGGVSIEDLQVGTGPIAKPGKMIKVYYVGRLKNNNKVFDSTKKGPGFHFRLGKNEVIKGWDVGVAGMKVGGKRRLIIPPNMAYGVKGSPPAIPGNSTLVFDIELKHVN